jgi:hypothetical protein
VIGGAEPQKKNPAVARTTATVGSKEERRSSRDLCGRARKLEKISRFGFHVVPTRSNRPETEVRGYISVHTQLQKQLHVRDDATLIIAHGFRDFF